MHIDEFSGAVLQSERLLRGEMKDVWMSRLHDSAMFISCGAAR